jgi:penicillin amidase
MKKFFKIAAISVSFFIFGFLLLLFLHFRISLPTIKGEILLKGIEKDVKIITDSWGVPHVFAQNERDLFFACGYIHAQERMWQMDLTRRSGFGELSEIFGRKIFKQDKIIRNLGLKEAAEKDFEKLSPEMKNFLLCYCRGINAWITSRKFNWPPEFLLLRYRPELWKPMDSIIIKQMMSRLLCLDFPSEAVRGRFVKKFGADKALQILEESIDVPPSSTEDTFLSETFFNIIYGGSNNWVISGERTESGKPLLANDPHLQIRVPPLWYEIHLKCPVFDVAGISLPGMPLVVIGHNAFIAWGITNSNADVQDLYVEKFNSSKDMYLNKNEWKPLQKKREIFRIEGEKEPEHMDIFWTERGPIISPLLIESQAPISLCWTIYEGGKGFDAFYLLNKARNWQEFVSAMKLFNSPSQNVVYADTQGNIGYYLSGRIPLRAKEVGLFPFPSWEENAAWEGYITDEEKPNLFNPPEGFIVTANHKIIPEDFPHYVSCEWESPFRAERIKELILQEEKLSIESLKRIQNDVYTKKGELILPFLDEIGKAEGSIKEALQILKEWNFQMDSGREPALFGIFMNCLHEEVFEDELGEDYRCFDLIFRRKPAGLLRILSDPHSLWFDNVKTSSLEKREEIIKLSLEKAYRWLRKKYGSPENWDWKKLNSVHFRHDLNEIPLFKFFNCGTYPVNGRAFTIRLAVSKDYYGLTHGASFRQIIDLSDFGNSVCVLSSGQSGHFLSHFYKNQIPLWLEGQYHPMLFDLDDIERRASGTLILKSLAQKQDEL